MGRIWSSIRLAFGLLTVIPVRLRDGEASVENLAAARYAFPLVGLVLGGLLAGLSELLSYLHAPNSIAAFLLISAAVALTGALHLDGLADTFDGLFLAGDRERRLATMRDPHIGTFGVTALVLVLLGKYAAISLLSRHDRSLGLIGAVFESRCLLLASAAVGQYARAEGTGRVFISSTGRPEATGFVSIALGLSLILLARNGAVAAFLALGVALGLSFLAKLRVGGITGDILGAVGELGELVYLVSLAWLQTRGPASA
jgi:adenosylcobinamide-GDP ribazoletransferase